MRDCTYSSPGLRDYSSSQLHPASVLPRTVNRNREDDSRATPPPRTPSMFTLTQNRDWVGNARAIRRPLPASVLPPTENRAWVDKSRPIRRPLPTYVLPPTENRASDRYNSRRTQRRSPDTSLLLPSRNVRTRSAMGAGRKNQNLCTVLRNPHSENSLTFAGTAVVEKFSVLDEVKIFDKFSILTPVFKALECLKQPSEVADEIRVASELLSGHVAKATEEASEVAYQVKAASDLLLDYANKKESRISYDPTGASRSFLGDSTLVPSKLSEEHVSKKRERDCERIVGASSTGGDAAIAGNSKSAPPSKHYRRKKVANKSQDPEKATADMERAKEFRGVRCREGVFASEIRVGGKNQIWLGTYKTPEAAARAHDAATYLRATYLGGKEPEYNHKDSASSFALSLNMEIWRPLEALKDLSLTPKARNKLVTEFAQAAGKAFAAQQDENLAETADNTERLVSVQAVDRVEDESQQEGSAEPMCPIIWTPEYVEMATVFSGSMARED
ncbi:unnamed protein product [Sphagnum troendelagicum]